jgi:hypothetical protein
MIIYCCSSCSCSSSRCCCVVVFLLSVVASVGSTVGYQVGFFGTSRTFMWSNDVGFLVFPGSAVQSDYRCSVDDGVLL